MISSPRRISSQQPPVPAPVPMASWADIDDDDGWQDMPVVRSDDNPFGLDEEDRRKLHYRPPARLDASEAGPSNSNATGEHLEVDADTKLGDDWRKRSELDEGDYTRIRLNEDEESEEVHMRTRYLFDDGKAMTPLSQMQATKELLTEGQRIAYVGLCQLIATRMLRDIARGWSGKKLQGLAKIKGKGKEEIPVVESGNIWMIKIMARLYQHMEVERDEQRMIESLAEHGVDPADLVPALMATHTVNNPDFDPKAKKKADEDEGEGSTNEVPPPYSPPPPLPDLPTVSSLEISTPIKTPPLRKKSVNPFGSDDEDDLPPTPRAPSLRLDKAPPPANPRMPSPDFDEDDGDIGRIASPVKPPSTTLSDVPVTPTMTSSELDEKEAVKDPGESVVKEGQEAMALPSLPGVSTSLSTTDEKVTLDIRWTVLCDLFLVLIGDSVYDARSRTFLEHVATALGFDWLDVVRFENRVTEALEIEEAVERTEQGGIIEGRRVKARNKRYAMMGMAAVGGGLIIGLSAGLMAPFIGAGLGAALATVGVSGTTGFLAGAGGAAVITTGGVLTGANIAGKGMARRTREVRTFEFKPVHNNKRVSCYIAVPGFMASKVDDVRLPFSTLDPIVGDVVSILWEPDMMAEMGGALKILTNEVLTSVGQQVLAATVMTALLSALQWPIILTKLGYLIDNPWSNALDRARAAGLVLADTIMQRHAGVRPVSLVGFSLGARAIFYALVELARCHAYGLVQDVFIFGTTVTASQSKWLDVRSAISGRFVNAFASNDWMLGYLFRATSGGLNTVAGLRAVEGVPGLENVDVTEIITGHMSYRSLMPQLLAKVGFPVTADYFDEPEDPEVDMSVQERTIVNEADEEAKRNRTKILGLFPVKKSATHGTGSGTATPQPSGRQSTSSLEKSSQEYEYEDGDADEPRSAQAHQLGHPSASKESLALEEDPEVRAIPKTAGFDFQAISRALGKDDIDVEKIKITDAPRIDPTLRNVLAGQLEPIERSGSAPPLSASIRPAQARSNSVFERPGEDDGDIGGSSSMSSEKYNGPSLEVPSWGPSSSSSPSAQPFDLPTLRLVPSLSSTNISAPSFGYNAWSTPSSSGPTNSAAVPVRAAPPARPHPPELMANPFATSSNGSDVSQIDTAAVSGAWGLKKPPSATDEQWAEKNPW